MGSSVLAERSRVTIVNGTRRAVWIAIYKRSFLRTHEPPIAWQVAFLPIRGKTAIPILRDFQVCARYSFEPEDSRRPMYQTNVLQVPGAPAGTSLLIEGLSSPDRRTWGAMLIRKGENPGWYQIRTTNLFSIGVWGHIRQDGRDIFPPRVLPPRMIWIEDLSSPLYVAVLPLPGNAGDLLLDPALALTEIAIKGGESFKIQGGPRKGYVISRLDPPKVRSRRKT